MADAPNAETYANFIPANVRRDAARADELARGMHPPGEEPTAEPVTEIVETPVAPTSTTVVNAQPTTDWEQRYRTLQGKYDHEVPTLRSDVARLGGQIESLQTLLASVQQTRAAEPAATVVAPVVPGEDIETYGEDLVAASRRWARAEFATEIDALRRQVDEVRQTAASAQQGTQQVQQHTAKQSVMAALDADPVIGSTWRATNNDPAFLAWLDQVDPFTGQQRISLLRDAFTRNDVGRTGAFFKSYQAEHTAPQVPTTTPAHTPQGAGRPTLEELASPGRASGPAPGGAPAGKKLWTQNDISAFYRDRTTGKFKDRDAEALALEQDLFNAMSEGRIRN